MPEIDTSIFWDIRKPLSYNALFNFIVGARGCGKTYGCKDWGIRSFLKNKKQFVYVRRYANELEESARLYWNDVSKAYPDHEFDYAAGEFTIDGETAGYAIPLSTAKSKKSKSFPDVNLIIFDEFILDKGYTRYLPDEVINFLELYETIARLRDDVRVFFISNALTTVNPYFLYFNVKVKKGEEFYCKNDILIQWCKNEDYAAVKSQTRFGKLISGTAYGDYAINNEILRDDSEFIKKRPTKKCRLRFNFVYNDETFGVWWDWGNDEMFVSTAYDPNQYTYAMTLEDHKPNLAILKGNNGDQMKKFKLYFRNGQLYYENEKIAGIVKQLMFHTF